MARRSGFTLIELLIVVVIIGVIAAIAVPKFKSTKGKAFTASIKSDLRNLATAQEAYFYEHATYSTNHTDLNYPKSEGVVIDLIGADAAGWSATAWHPAAAPIECGLFFGTGAPSGGATTEGRIGCLNSP